MESTGTVHLTVRDGIIDTHELAPLVDAMRAIVVGLEVSSRASLVQLPNDARACLAEVLTFGVKSQPDWNQLSTWIDSVAMHLGEFLVAIPETFHQVTDRMSLLDDRTDPAVMKAVLGEMEATEIYLRGVEGLAQMTLDVIQGRGLVPPLKLLARLGVLGELRALVQQQVYSPAQAVRDSLDTARCVREVEWVLSDCLEVCTSWSRNRAYLHTSGLPADSAESFASFICLLDDNVGHLHSSATIVDKYLKTRRTNGLSGVDQDLDEVVTTFLQGITNTAQLMRQLTHDFLPRQIPTAREEGRSRLIESLETVRASVTEYGMRIEELAARCIAIQADVAMLVEDATG